MAPHLHVAFCDGLGDGFAGLVLVTPFALGSFGNGISTAIEM